MKKAHTSPYLEIHNYRFESCPDYKKKFMESKLKIIRNSDRHIFEVHKYIFSENQHSVWCNEWYGRHVIGQDCDWF